MKSFTNLFTGSKKFKLGWLRRPPLINLLADQEPPPASAGRLDQRTQQTLFIGAGVLAVGGAIYLATTHGLTPLVVTSRLIALLRHTPFGPPLYIAAYATLPLLLFPASLLTIAGGLLFGAGPGLVYALIGGNLATFAAYRIGRRLRALRKSSASQEPAEPARLHGIKKFVNRLQAHPFVTVLTMHCLFIPMEWVSYGAGLLGIPERAFVTATAIGILPGTTSIVLASASVQGTILTGLPTLNPAMLAVGGLILIGTVAIAGVVNWRAEQVTVDPTTAPTPLGLTESAMTAA